MHCVRRRYFVAPEVLVNIDPIGNQTAGQTATLSLSTQSGEEAREGFVRYNGVLTPHLEWSANRIVLLWPDLGFDADHISSRYAVTYSLDVFSGNSVGTRGVATLTRQEDELFVASDPVSPTGIFANDTGVAGRRVVFRADVGTLYSISSAGDIVTSVPFQGRYNAYDNGWDATAAQVTVS